MKVAAAWSGGKDSAFAVYKALQQGHHVSDLVTFMRTEDISNFHGLKVEVLEAQSEAVGIPLVERVTTPSHYETQFKGELMRLKSQGVEGLVTGDIYEVPLHEQGWLVRVCGEVGLKPIRPLWQGDTLKIMRDFLDAGFEAFVVRTKAEILGEEWLGRRVDGQFLDDLMKLGGVDPCGEMGEFHTVVTDGPNFHSKIKLLETEKSVVDGFGRLAILRFAVAPKNR